MTRWRVRQATGFSGSRSRHNGARIKPGSFFLKLATHGEPFKYAHTGIVVRADNETFASIEGNTNDEGSAEGFEVCARTRSYTGMDFILI